MLPHPVDDVESPPVLIFPRTASQSRKRELVLLAGGVIAGLMLGGLMVSRRDPAATAAPPEPEAVATNVPAEKPAAARFHGPSERALREDAERRKQLEHLRQLDQAEPAAAGERYVRSRTQVSTPAPAPSDATAAGASSLRYWNALNDAIEREATARGNPGASFSETGAREFLERRVASANAASQQVRRISGDQVDPALLAFGGELASFYDACAKAAHRGATVMQLDVKQRQGTAGKAWQADENKIAESAKAVNARGEALRDELAKKYGVSFPPLK